MWIQHENVDYDYLSMFCCTTVQTQSRHETYLLGNSLGWGIPSGLEVRDPVSDFVPMTRISKLPEALRFESSTTNRRVAQDKIKIR